MTPAEIIAAAREAGLQLNLYAEAYPLINEQLQRFAAIIAAKQREKDADLCEKLSAKADDPDAHAKRDSKEWDDLYWACPASMLMCAEAIRGQE